MKSAIKANWEAYHYCLGRSPKVELSIGRYLTWLMTDLPDFFMNLVVSTRLPSEDADELIESALAHFQSMNIRKLSWLAHEGVPSTETSTALLAHGLTFRESYATEMAVDLSLLPKDQPIHPDLRIIPVVDGYVLQVLVSKSVRSSSRFGTIFSQMQSLIRSFEPTLPYRMETRLELRSYSSPRG